MAEEVDPASLGDQTILRYKIWKKNSPYLYDYFQSKSLLWPSLSVEFLPDIERNDEDEFDYQRLIFGTFTSGASNEFLNFGMFSRHNEVSLRESLRNSLDNFDSVKGEISPLVLPSSKDSKNSNRNCEKLSIIQRISHNGEVNKCKYLPQNPDIIATINNYGSVFIFDRTKHPSQPLSGTIKPDIHCTYHKDEGSCLSWNPSVEGELLSGSMDGTVVLWDIKTYTKDKDSLNPYKIFIAHDNGCNDVKFIPRHTSIFGSVGEDGFFKLWDTRQGLDPVKSAQIHQVGINSLSFNDQVPFTVATGDAEGQIKLFDLRNLTNAIKDIKAHEESISTLEWNPHNSLLGSCSMDKTVKIWDFGDNEQPLKFTHGGHMFGVNDISWNPWDETMISSVGEDNSLHIWKPSKSIIGV
ncbi:BA75_00486T0 [Komagataella pastoris]|uniref:BA75_00486T0 n=1 Tax=Komagataella pastoris TaxID=4922 RepID=A0A1B2J6Z6_PICPA|nr:BA75_00486T0 [Komagataella pastoris]